MIVTNYHMHNVLKVYSRQLSQGGTAERSNPRIRREETDRVSISAEGKRRAIIEKVTADIVEKLTDYGAQSEDVDPEVDSKLADASAESREEAGKGKNTFVFNVLDAINRKTTNRLSVEDSSSLLKRFDQGTEPVD